MKKKIHGLSILTNQFIAEDNICFDDIINLIDPFVKTQFSGFNFPSVVDGMLTKRGIDGTFFKNKPLYIIELKLKKKQREQIKQILSNNKSDNKLTFFWHCIYDENEIEVSKEIHFRSNRYRINDFTLYHFLYQMRKLVPNLLIDLEMMLYGSL